ncbi:MAG: hypothetical protein IKE93_04375 [Erysipelotrichaceae bacterium]|nr:hypothetical protein [Erysipelotrichaceae bacterium]
MVKAKKDYTARDAQDIDLVDGITEGQTAAAKKPVKKDSKSEVPQNRFTARFSDLEWKYLQEKHWTDRISVTDILRQYVQADMKKNPDILKRVDELNG